MRCRRQPDENRGGVRACGGSASHRTSIPARSGQNPSGLHHVTGRMVRLPAADRSACLMARGRAQMICGGELIAYRR